jgi:hypothetical protein
MGLLKTAIRQLARHTLGLMEVEKVRRDRCGTEVGHYYIVLYGNVNEILELEMEFFIHK